MARTLNGNMTGKAASLHLAELRNEQYIRQMYERRETHRFRVRFNWFLRKLKRLDPAWEVWYDGRPEQTCGEMLPLIIERVSLLESQKAEARAKDGEELHK